MQVDRFKKMTNEKSGMLKCPTCSDNRVEVVGIKNMKRSGRGRVVEMEFHCVEKHRFMLEFIQSSLGMTFELWEGSW